MKKYYQASMIIADNEMTKYLSPSFKTLQKVKEWINNEISDENKYEYLARIEIDAITSNDYGFIISKNTKYYYEW